MTPEEFAELSVPFIDIDPRFNFWNLPANAKVLLVSNMPEAITKPLEVFNLFSVYGDVMRVKVLKEKPSTTTETPTRCALVEFKNATSATIARNGLDQFDIFDFKLFVTFSKYDRIRMPEEAGLEDDGRTMDFSGSEYDKYRYRFADIKATRKNLPRAVRPSWCIQAINIGPTVTANQVKDWAEKELGLEVFDILAVKAKEASKNEPEFDRHMLISLKTRSDGVVAMAKLPGLFPKDAEDTGFKCFFHRSTAPKEREKIEKKKSASEYKIISNDSPIPA